MTRILLIEDNEANQDLISRYLALFGCEVTVAGDGLTGLERARRDRAQFNLVLMDVNLPHMDGWEVTRRLKADAETRSLPVIALTAHAMQGDRETALSAGCTRTSGQPPCGPCSRPTAAKKLTRLTVTGVCSPTDASAKRRNPEPPVLRPLTPPRSPLPSRRFSWYSNQSQHNPGRRVEPRTLRAPESQPEGPPEVAPSPWSTAT